MWAEWPEARDALLLDLANVKLTGSEDVLDAGYFLDVELEQLGYFFNTVQYNFDLFREEGHTIPEEVREPNAEQSIEQLNSFRKARDAFVEDAREDLLD